MRSEKNYASASWGVFKNNSNEIGTTYSPQLTVTWETCHKHAQHTSAEEKNQPIKQNDQCVITALACMTGTHMGEPSSEKIYNRLKKIIINNALNLDEESAQAIFLMNRRYYLNDARL